MKRRGWKLKTVIRTSHTHWCQKSSSDIYIYTQVNVDSILLLWTNNQLDLQLYWCDHRHQLLEMSTGRQWSAFSALTLLVGRQQEHPACKNWVMWCWCGYLSGVRCRLFAYGPADVTAIPKPHHLLTHLNPDWSTFLVAACLGCPGKEAVKWMY